MPTPIRHTRFSNLIALKQIGILNFLRIYKTNSFLKKQALTLVLIIFYLNSNTKAQSLANYASARNTGVTYNSISTSGNSFSTWRNTATFTQDDNRSDFVNIGFDYWYNGIRYTQFCISTNGFIDFSTSTDDGGPNADDFGYANTAFTNANIANSTNPAIAPFYDDLMAPGGVNPLGTSCKYLLSGTAPNRTLTVEWLNMAVFGNTTPSLNFQVKLVETTGQIIIHYGTMNTGTQIFSYSMGLNSTTLSAVPTAAQLKMLQTVNNNVFSNTIQNNLSAMPTANSQYIFTPPVPTAPSGGLSFTGVSQTSMTLNWTNWAGNEVGYVIYNSTDGVNYTFVSQTPANATSGVVSGLNSNTTYFWRLHAVTEGNLSAAINGTQATTVGGNKVSNASGNWGTATIWTPNGVPAPGDNVTISNGHTVTINTNANCNALTIGNGLATRLEFGTATARSLTVNSNILVNASASLNVATNSDVTHTLLVKGNLTNNGILNFATDANSLCNTIFNSNSSQFISGTGTTSNFNLITVNLGTSSDNNLNVSSSNFSAATGFLTLNNGTLRISTTNATTLVPFTASASIAQSCGLWLNSASAVVTTSAGIALIGKIIVSGGTLNIGNAANEDILISGGTFSITGGVANISGKFYTTGINNLCNFNLSGGVLNVPTIGSTSTTDAPFQITGVGSQFNMTGGLINLIREGGTGAQDLGFVNTGGTIGTVTNGTLQIGTAATPAAQTISINSLAAISNLNVNSANATARLITNSLTITSNITITSGTLHANALDMALGGNWANNGGIFVGSTGLVNFNSAAAQTIFRSGGETFNRINFSGGGSKTLASPITADGNFSISTGSNLDVSASNHSITLRGNFVNNGALNTRSGLVFFNGTAAQTIGGTSITDFYDVTLNNNSGASLIGTENLISSLTLNNGVFNTNGQVFTMVSTATATARIAQITGTGDITGNVTVQRFIPGGSTGWALLGNPISSALTLNDWDDDIVISCPTCPDGYVNNFPSVYRYDETQPGIYDAPASYIPLSTINDAIIAGRGYWVYTGTGLVTTNNITIDATGVVRKFNYSIPLNYTNSGSAADDGWNLITNPYPSPISWNLLRGATANIDNAIYVYNADLNGGTGAYASFVNGISSPDVPSGGIGDVIPMSQGFYVHSTGATVLNAQESNKTGGNPTFLKSNSSASSSNPLLRLKLSHSNLYTDEAVLYLQPGASNGFDTGFDSYKMRGQDPLAPFIVLENGADQFQINGIAPITGNYTTSLKTLTGYSGTYTISALNISSFPDGACISLYDKFTSITTDLKNSDYVFNLMDTTTIARFILSITINTLSVNANVIQPTCEQINDGKIIAKGNNNGPWNYVWKLNGSVIKTSLNKYSYDTLTGLSGGTIDMEINTIGMCDNSQTSYQINTLEQTISQFNSPDTFNINLPYPIQFTNTSINSTTSYWDFGDNNGFSSTYSPAYSYSQPGLYKAMLISTSNTGCTDTAYKIITVTGNMTGILANQNDPDKIILKTLNDNEYAITQERYTMEFVTVKLYDSSGKLVNDFGKYSPGVLEILVDLNAYKSGLYLLKISSETVQKTIKLLRR